MRHIKRKRIEMTLVNDEVEMNVKVAESEYELIKTEVRDDMYWTIEGLTGSKSDTRVFLNTYFDVLWNMYGDTKDLYYACMKLIGAKETNNIWSIK